MQPLTYIINEKLPRESAATLCSKVASDINSHNLPWHIMNKQINEYEDQTNLQILNIKYIGILLFHCK